MGSDWIILELSPFGESASLAELEHTIHEMFGEAVDYFIPTHHEKVGSYTTTSVLFEGYVFIKDESEVRAQLSEITDFKLFSRALGNRKKFHTVDSRTIGTLRQKLKNSMKKKIAPGSMVQILDGIFQNLTGEVIDNEDDGKKVVVRVRRLSRDMIVPLPATSVIEIAKPGEVDG